MKRIAGIFLLFYAVSTFASGWNVQEIADTLRLSGPYLPAETSIALGRNGLPAISYAKFVIGGYSPEIYCISLTTTAGWADEGSGIWDEWQINSFFDGYSQTSLAFGPDNKPYVLWGYNEWDPTVQDPQYSYVFISSRSPSGQWSKYAVISSSPVAGDQYTWPHAMPCDLFISTNGSIYVAGGVKLNMYEAETGRVRIFYRKYSPGTGWDAVEWLTPTEDADGNQRVSVTVSEGGVPHIVYCDSTTATGKHLYKTGSTWNTEILGANESGYSIQIPDDGTRRISCYSKPLNDLRFYGIVQETVDSAGDVGRGSNLVCGTGGIPHIVYCDDSNYTLKFASKTAAGWRYSVVDSGGEYAGLAVDKQGLPHISYIKDDKIRYAHWDNTPPETITDLLANSSMLESQKITLDWSIPGDDGASYPLLNSATFYIQFSTSANSGWNIAGSQLIVPATAACRGERHAATLTGLALKTTYYFSIWTKDYAGNISGRHTQLSQAINYIALLPITDLKSSVGVRCTTLTWTAPGDEAQPGPLSRYEIRYSKNGPFIWDSAVILTSTRPSSGPAGTQEQEILLTIPYDATYYFKIKGFDEFGQESLSNITAFYLPKCPILPPIERPFNPLLITSSSITVEWDSNGNPSDTEYILHMSTSASFNFVRSSFSTYNLYYNVQGLAANYGYHFRCAAVDYRGLLTDWTIMTPISPKYTRIEPVPDLFSSGGSMFAAVEQDYITVDLSAFNFSNLSSGGSGLFFEETGFGGQWSSGWTANKIWPRRLNNPQGAPSLTPNTTYQFRILSRNYELLENQPIKTIKATKIEEVASLEFVIFQTSIAVTAKSTSTGAGFTNVGAGNSAIYYSICSSTSAPLNWVNPAYSNEVWSPSPGAFVFKELGDGTTLTPNTWYFFRSNSRNSEGVYNSTSPIFACVTLCERPGAPQIQPETDVSITINGFDAGKNPAETLYALAITTCPDWSLSYYSNGSTSAVLTSSPVWKIHNDWIVPGRITGLLPNTIYRIRAVALNKEGVENHGFEAQFCTYASVPSEIKISTVSTSSIHIKWAGNGSFYDLQYSTTPVSGIWSDLLISSNITIYYNTGLLPGSKRYYRVRSRNLMEMTTPGGWTSGNDYGFTLPETPSGISIESVGISSFTLRWRDTLNSTGTTTYLIEISTNPGFISTVYSETGYFETLEKVIPAGFVPPDSFFWARVAPISGDAVKEYNFGLFIVAGASCTLIENPEFIEFSGITCNSVTLLVKKSASENMPCDISDTGGDGIRVRERFKGWVSQWRDSYSGSVEDIFSQRLLPGTSYYFSVQARNKHLIETQWSQDYRIISGVESPPVLPEAPLPSPMAAGVVSLLSIAAPYFTGEIFCGVSTEAEPEIKFSCEIDTSSIDEIIALKAVKDNSGRAVSENIKGQIQYEKAGKKIKFVPSVPLKKGHSYRFSLSKSGGISSLKFETVFDHTLENLVEDSATDTSIRLKDNSLPKDGYVISAGADPGLFEYGQVIKCRRIVPFDEDKNQQNCSPGANVMLSMGYADKDCDGIVDGTNPKVQINSLAIYSFNDSSGKWERLFTEINMTQKTANAPVSHFSKFLLAGLKNTDPSKAYAYPVPFEPSKGHTSIIFGRNPDAPLPSECLIRIYSVSGEFVRELVENDGDGMLSWYPVADWKNNELNYGTYIYVIDSGISKKTGKIMIIR